MSTDVPVNNRKLPQLSDSGVFFKWRAETINLLMQKGPDVYDAIMLETPVPAIGTQEYKEWRRYELVA